MDSLAAAVASRAQQLNSQELSMCAWALAVGGVASGGAIEAVSAAAREKMDRGGGSKNGFSAQQLSTIAWSLAKLGVHDPRLLASVSRVAVRCDPASFNAQDLANLAWAFPRVRATAPKPLLDFIAETSRGLLESAKDRGERDRESRGFKPQNLAMLVWAYGHQKAKVGCLLWFPV